ncbi:recombination regulator RecX [Candidatus Clostridium stratigraminis]|uniref:Regulatory protein RecX n=1 Tax=Candidatus Clostridium stratigraminis TaxID=3381661 RepID=A0ABW8T679_9CLOT
MIEKITKIEIQKKNEDRVNIYINYEYAFSCSKELVYTHKLSNGQQIERDALNTIAAEDNYIKCKNSALRIIERTYKSEKELFDKLFEKGYDDQTIEKTIEFLKNYSFLNDSTFTKMYIKDKIKTQGKNKIKFTLIKKGISEEIINNELQELNTEDQNDTIMTLAEKKYKTLQKNEQDSRKLYKKLADFLIRKGFQWEEVKPALKHLLNEDSFEE